jgi:DNA-binding SARP family transcriptional activator
VLDGVGKVVSTQRRRLALLALIAASGRRGISRDKVLAYLWPESSTANARHGLEQLLYGLRRQLGASVFMGSDPLRLDQELLTSDVTEFDEAFERGDVTAAISLYRGPFLDGFHLGDSGEFERWAETERTRLTQRYATALEQRAHQASQAGDQVAAVGHWRKLVALDPLSAHATLGLMNALAEAHETTEAIRHGRAYEALARADDTEPAAAVAALLRRLVGEESQREPPASSSWTSAVAHAAETFDGEGDSAPRRSLLGSSRRAAAAGAAGLTVLLLALGSRYGVKHSVVIVGTGDPAKDVPAFQAAVDRGGEITVAGHFSFDVPPTQPIDPLLASGWFPAKAEIRISKSVDILGTRDVRDQMATIESGTIPFYVDAPGETVAIRGLRFVRPTQAAILVRAVRGLEISSSRIEGVVPFTMGAAGISINTRGDMPLPSSPGSPASVSGRLLIAHNDIDGTGGTAHLPTAGVNIFSVGQSPEKEVDLDILGNHVTNTTAPTINIRRVHGPIRIVGNSVQTSPETVGDVDAVRLVNGGSILMANNTVECKWPNAAGIQIYSPFVEWPTRQVTVEDNDVLMTPSATSPLGDFSAAISIRGYADGVMVRRNNISGHARTALAMYAFRGGVPSDNAFIDNRLDGFQAALADIFVGSGVARARIVGPGSVSDHGAATTRQR